MIGMVTFFYLLLFYLNRQIKRIYLKHLFLFLDFKQTKKYLGNHGGFFRNFIHLNLFKEEEIETNI